jgi:NTE family protein
LRDEGRKAADEFLTEHADSIGKRSTLDIDRMVEGT